MKLENQYLLVEVSEDGAEITKIYNKEDGTDIIWEGNPEFWKRHSPVLFPNVGKTYKNKMLINGEEYTTSQHGFARDSVFECVESTDSMVSFLLNSSEETKKKYPFDFKLFVNYYLEGKEVKVEWKVENTGNETMYFTIGAHPAFRFAKKDEVKSDYILKFPGKDQLEYILVDKETEDGTITSLIVRPTVLQIPEYLSIYATSQTGLHLYTTNSFVFGAYSSNIHISDISLCKVFTDFFTGLSGSPMVYSKEETLCLLKQYISLIP